MTAQYSNVIDIYKLAIDYGQNIFQASCRDHKDNVISMSISPIKLEHISDIILKHAKEYLIVFSVECVEMDYKSLEQIANEFGIEYKLLSSGIIIISKHDFKRIIELGHWMFHIVDYPNLPDQETGKRLVLVLNKLDCSKIDESFLTKVSDSEIFIDSHDFTCFGIESYNPNVIKEIFKRTLLIYCGLVFRYKGLTIENVSEIPDSIINQIYPLNSLISIVSAHSKKSDNKIIIPLSNENEITLSNRNYNIINYIEYNFSTREWNLTNYKQ